MQRLLKMVQSIVDDNNKDNNNDINKNEDTTIVKTRMAMMMPNLLP